MKLFIIFVKICFVFLSVFVFTGCYDSGISAPPTISLPPPLPPSPPCLFDCGGDDNSPPVNPPTEENVRTSEFNRNYGLDRINADHAYQRGYFGQGVTVGVIDTGVRTTHDELDNNVVTGRDFVFSRNAVNDPHGHGTAVAGVIAGERDTRGAHGVAPRAKIMPLKISDSSGRLVGNWRDALRYAVGRNVHIINNSYGDIEQQIYGTYQGQTYFAEIPLLRGFLSDRDRRLAQEVTGIVRNRDTVLVWAAGNGGWNGSTGRIRLRRALCNDLRNDNCDSGTAVLRLTRDQFTTGFISEGFRDYSGNFLPGEGRLSDTDGSDVPDLSSYYSSLPLWTVNNINSLLDRAESGAITAEQLGSTLLSDSNFLALYPRVVAVVATDRNNNIAEFSNGCGPALLWCLAAPGVNIYAPNATGDTTFRNVNGTSFAAPHVSGALAVLKSRLPSTPMSVIVAIMLTTATDRGATGVDQTYGWGLLNLDAAVRYTGNLQLQGASSSTQLLNARIDLPPALAHLKPRLETAQIAVGGVGNSYYNMPLSDIAHIDISKKSRLGDAASDMLSFSDEHFNAGIFFTATDNKTNQFRYAGANVSLGALGEWSLRHDFCGDCEESVWKNWNSSALSDSAPFFANDKSAFVLSMRGDGLRPFVSFSGETHGAGDAPYQQLGFRWQKTGARLGAVVEVSEVSEEQTFMGADFGPLGKTKTSTRQGRILLRGKLGSNWKGIAIYEHARANADLTGGFLSEISGARADGWTAGVEGEDVFSGGDRLRLSARRKTGLRAGHAVLRHLNAQGDFAAAFYRDAVGVPEHMRGEAQTLQEQQTVINLSDKSETVLAIGYAMRPAHKIQLAAGMEYNSQSNESAISAALQMEF